MVTDAFEDDDEGVMSFVCRAGRLDPEKVFGWLADNIGPGDTNGDVSLSRFGDRYSITVCFTDEFVAAAVVDTGEAQNAR